MTEVTRTGIASVDDHQEHKAMAVATDVDDLPLLCDTAYLAKLLGWGPTYVARLAKQGKIPGAAKVGRSYRFNLRETLRGLGLLHDEPGE